MTDDTRLNTQLAIHGGSPVRTGWLEPRKCFGPEEIREVTEALESQSLFYAGGTKVYAFLDAFRELYNVQGVVPSTSGTAALHVAVGALNPEPGDEIIVSPVTDMGSIAAIVLGGAVPVFVDVEPETFNMDPADVARKITDRTKAIMVDPRLGPARQHRWRARAPSATATSRSSRIAPRRTTFATRDELVGTIGDIGALSFQQSKHITSGDGGITIVNAPELLPRAELFVDKGCDWTKDRTYRETYAFMAPCYRMTELQGAVLMVQVAKLPGIIEARRKAGGWLAEQLQELPGVVAPPMPDEEYDHGYWGFPLRDRGGGPGRKPGRLPEGAGGRRHQDGHMDRQAAVPVRGPGQADYVRLVAVAVPRHRAGDAFVRAGPVSQRGEGTGAALQCRPHPRTDHRGGASGRCRRGEESGKWIESVDP